MTKAVDASANFISVGQYPNSTAFLTTSFCKTPAAPLEIAAELSSAFEWIIIKNHLNGQQKLPQVHCVFRISGTSLLHT
jgi:hypothetical protein